MDLSIYFVGSEYSGGAKHQEGAVGSCACAIHLRCHEGINALKSSAPVVFCSSEEKRAWKQRHEGIGSERSAALFDIRTLEMQPHERQEHETRLRTGYTEVKPGEVEKTCAGDLTADWTPRVMLSVFPERFRGRNSMRVFHLFFGSFGGFSQVTP